MNADDTGNDDLDNSEIIRFRGLRGEEDDSHLQSPSADFQVVARCCNTRIRI